MEEAGINRQAKFSQREYDARPDVKARRQRRFQQAYHDPQGRMRFNARSVTRYAIKRGEIVKKPCEVCGAAKVEAHHTDYSKPYEITWLCRQHHAQAHSGSGATGNKASFITHNGVTKTMRDWGRALGLAHSTIGKRLRAGWTVEEALTTKSTAKVTT